MSSHVPEHIKPAFKSIISEFKMHLEAILGKSIKVNISIVDTKTITPELIQQLICEAFEVEWYQVQGKSKPTPIVTARESYCYLSKMFFPKKSFRLIGIEINRDHSTVMAAVKTINGFLDTNDEYICKKISQLINALNGIVNEH